jgi:prepilin-type N-terminal cleavage/methylation domain-containing protein
MQRISSPRSERGFTLVELAVVLVIIGLLVGGVLTGQTLIKASQLRGIISDFQRYSAAVGSFRNMHSGLPGDISTAEDIFGAGATDPGNGNNQISSETNNEPGLFWQHLALAGLIEGSYSPGSWAALTAANTGASKMDNGKWSIRWIGIIGIDDGAAGAGNDVFFEGNYENAFVLMSGTDLSAPSGAVLRAEEAWNIDEKLDDGMPALGSVLSLESQGVSATSGCSNLAPRTTSSAAAVYNVTLADISCSLVINSGF